MKIDVSSIVLDHLRTLRKANKNKISLGDIGLFYFFPVAAGTLAISLGFGARADAYNASITFFGIFIALLLNIQVGMFAIFQRKWEISTDPRIALIQQETIRDRRTLLTELNANISYLILVCCVSLVGSFLFYLNKWETDFAPSLILVLYLHFLLTLLMIVKRAHALFHKEYRDTR
jgi:hypothetical protein